jgi:aryl-alcohol dehydrogenase-like predicted oxidoreductase
MKKIKLGTTDIKISQLGLGCINFGTTVSEERSFKLMDTYIEQEGNFFDTANNYAVWNGGDGRDSERTIGAWLKKMNNRKEVVLATKLGALPKDMNKKDFSNLQGLGDKIIFEEVEKSLDALGVEYIDLLYLHVDDFNTPQEETLNALNEVIKKGYVKEIGCSNFLAWRIESAREICAKNNYKFFSAIQQRLSYLYPAADADFFPQIVYNEELEAWLNYHEDMTLVSYSALLAGMYNKPSITDEVYMTAHNEKKFAEVKKQENPNGFVLKKVTELHGGSVALITSSSPEHLVENMRSVG